MKKTSIALSVLVAAGAACAAGAWYTGSQLEGVLQTSIEQSNQQLQSLRPGLNISLELLSLDRGFFSSTAHYRLNLAKASGEQTGEARFVDHIEHGPLPLSRLASLKLWPVMATSRFELEETPAVKAWFVASKGVSPLTGETSIGYDHGVSGSLNLQPLELSQKEFGVSFSGLNAEFKSSANAEKIKLAGQMDRLHLDITGAQTGQFEIQGMTLLSDRSLGQSGLYLGNSQLSLDRLQIELGDNPPLLLNDLLQSDSLEEKDNRLAASFAYDLGKLSYDGRALGSSRFAASLANLDMTAMKFLSDFYSTYMLRLQARQGTELSAPERAQLQASIDRLLAGKPSLTLSELSLKTANGESSFTLHIDLNKPESYALAPAELARQLIEELDARLVLAKPTIRDMLVYKAAFEPDADLAAVAQQARMAADMAGEMAGAMQIGKLEGENIVTQLSYAAGQVDFNGQRMPVEQFVGMLLALSGGMAGGVDAPAAGDQE